MSVAAVFERLQKRRPSEEDLRRLYDIGAAVGADDDDAFFALIVALDYYHGLYSAVPSRLADACEKAARTAVATTGITIEGLTAKAVKCATEAIQKAVQASARAASITTAFKWICSGLIIGALVLAVVVVHIHRHSLEAGIARGRAQQRDEELYMKKRDATLSALSPDDAAVVVDMIRDGSLRQAAGLRHTGALDLVYNCSGQGWEIKNDVCFPYVGGDNFIRGWRLPPGKKK
jgi:hypothetical protein